MLAALLGAAAPASVRSEGPSAGIVQVDRLHLRRGPGADHPPVALLEKGTRLRVLAEADGWLEVEAGDRRGFVNGDARFVSREGDPPPEGAARDIAHLREEAATIDRSLQQHRAALEGASAAETDLAARLETLDIAIADKRRQAARLQEGLHALEARVAATQAEERQVAAALAGQEADLTHRLVALYKLNRLGPVHVLAAADSIQEMMQRKFLLERVLAADDRRLTRYREDRQRLEALGAQLEGERRELAGLEAAYRAQLAALTDDRRQRSLLLEEIRNKKELELAAIESLQRSAAELEAIIGDLTRQAASAAAGSGPAGSFGGSRGRLEMPVAGRVVTHFGPFRNTRYNVMNFRSGVDIAAERGEPIRAVFGGRVLFADYFKGYGHMLIIDHGQNYCTLYAHLEELFKQKGAPVEQGEVIATVGDSGSLTGPGLYFEVRHLGKPEDPLKWFKQG